jgi:hypothetical protein
LLLQRLDLEDDKGLGGVVGAWLGGEEGAPREEGLDFCGGGGLLLPLPVVVNEDACGSRVKGARGHFSPCFRHTGEGMLSADC